MKKRVLSFLLVLTMALSISAFACAETPTSIARSGVVRLVEAFLSDGEIDSVYLSTAFFVGREGEPVQYLVTNYHTVENYLLNSRGNVYEYRDQYGTRHDGQYRLNVFFNADNAVEAYVADYDEGQDIALLKLDDPTEERSALALQIPDDSLVGDTIYIVGFPGVADDFMDSTSSWGMEDALVAKGTLGRLVTESATGTKWIQSSDMAASQGSSGSPILTEEGMVIGLVSKAMEDRSLYVNVDITPVVDMLKKNQVPFDTAEDRIEETPAVVTPEPEPEVTEELPATPEPTPAVDEAPAGLPTWAYAAIGGAALLLLIIIIAASRSAKKKKAAAAAAEEAARAEAEAIQKTVPAAAPEKPLRPMVHSMAEQHKNQKVSVKDITILAGRSTDCGIIYKAETPGVSGRHCSISWDAGSHDFIVKDVGSTYGTYLESGMKLEPNKEYRLKAGESIYLGEKENMLRMEVE